MPSTPEADLTELLGRVANGDAAAREQVVLVVYPELQRIARSLMRFERKDHPLQPTAICNEAYVRLLEDKHRNWQNRAHFFACASTEMRRIIVDYARMRRAAKRGGGLARLDVHAMNLQSPDVNLDLVIAVDRALMRLAERDPRQARVVELRYFTGLTEEQIAAVLGVSARSVKRDWAFARDWLYAELIACDSPLPE